MGIFSKKTVYGGGGGGSGLVKHTIAYCVSVGGGGGGEDNTVYTVNGGSSETDGWIDGRHESRSDKWIEENKDVTDEIDVEKLFLKMIEHGKNIFVSCLHCGTSNSITNSNCCKCGVGLGEAISKLWN